MPATDGPSLDLARLIEALNRHGVEHLLCGGAGATAYGADRLSEHADCVVRRDRANLNRLAAALRELNARLRVATMTDEEAKSLPVQIDGTTLADLSDVTLRELMATIGHSSHVAALRFQHATAERSRAIADYLDGVIDVVQTPPTAPIHLAP